MSIKLERAMERMRAEFERLREQIAAPDVRLFSLKDAARVLDVSLSTLVQMIRAQKILPVKLGGRRMVPASEIRRLSIEGDRGPSRRSKATVRPRRRARAVRKQ
jgi:excisionase family DNA binding protein